MNLFKSLLISTCFFASSFMNAQTCTAAFTYTVAGNTVIYSNTSTYNGTSTPVYTWGFGTGPTFTTTSNGSVSATYSVNSIYAPYLIMTAADCHASLLDTFTFFVPGCPLSIRPNTIAGFSANAIGTTSNTTYLWDFDDGTTSTALNPTHTYSLNGWYNYSLTATESPTCTAFFPFDSYALSFFMLGGVGVCSSSSSISAVQGLGGNVSFTLTGFKNNGYIVPASNSFIWNFGDFSTLGFGLNVNHTFFTGTYTTKVTYQGPLNCPVTSSLAVITITNNPCIVNSAFTSTLGASGSVQFSPNVAPSSSNIAYSWNFGDGVISNAFNPAHTYASQGTYSVSLTVYNVTNSFVCQQTNTANVVVTGIPCLANSGFSLLPIIGQPHTYYIIPNYPYNVSSAIWNWGDGSSTNILYTNHTYSASGNYNICLTVTVSCNGTSSTCVNQFLAKQEALDMVNVTVQAPALSTNINTQKMIESDLGLFPNPNDGLFYIESESPILLSDVKIVDMMGKEISALSISAEENRYKLKIGNVDNGVYFITINTPQKIFRSRLIISK